MNEIDHFIIKGDNKTYEFKMDTSSVDYKSLSKINPDWIKAIDVLKNKQLEGGAKTVVVITLKNNKFNKLPVDMRNKFVE